MSMFPMTEIPFAGAKAWEKYTAGFAAPREFSSVMDVSVNPAANAMAFSMMSVGMTSHVLGTWIGLMTGAAQSSQRIFAAGFATAGAVAPKEMAVVAAPKPRPASPLLVAKAVEKVEAPAVEAVAPAPEPRPAPTLVAKAVEKLVTPLAPAAKPVAAVAKAVEAAAKPAEVIAKPAEKTLAATAAEPVAKVAKPARAVKTVKAAPEIVPDLKEAVAEKAPAPIEPAVVAAQPAANLLPEDFRAPKSMDKPETPDDLKAIAGIGPKLEKVLNGLGVWTYGQIAALSREEIAWLDDYLSFKGRIDRDGWLAQAAKLTGKPKG